MDKKEKIPGLINYAKAQKIHQNWLETSGKAITDVLGHDTSYEVNFSARALLDYLEYVIETSEAQGLKDPGIRIAFGAYINKKTPSSKQGKTNTTVVLVPTKESSVTSKYNKDISPLNRANTGWPPVGL